MCPSAIMATRPRHTVDQHLWKDPAVQQGREHPFRQPVLRPDDRHLPLHLGDRITQPLPVRFPARDRQAAHQRRRARHLGRDQPRRRRCQLRLAGDRRTASRPVAAGRLQRSDLRLSARHRGWRGEHYRRCVLRRRSFPGIVRWPLLFRRLRRRVHQVHQRGRSVRVAATVRDGFRVSDRSELLDRWAHSGCSITATSIPPPARW